MRRALVAAAAALAVLPSAAAASPTQESTFQDDSLIVYNTPEGMTKTLARVKAMGADRVRVSVFWNLVAPAPTSQARPAFDASDPAAYPPGSWDRYDRIARVAKAIGLAVNFNPTSPAPSWATGSPAGRPDIDATFNPSAQEFGQFVHALGRRYDGTYVPAAGAAALPRVDYWTIWNEPNQSGWLTPQWVKDPANASRIVEASPLLYRQLVDAAFTSLGATGHASDTILIGETAPKGLEKPALNDPRAITRSMDALHFLRQLYCLDDNLQFLQGVQGCPASNQTATFPQEHPGLFHMTGYAHHPYELIFAPDQKPAFRDRWVTIANLGDLSRTLRHIFQRYAQPLPGGHHEVPLYLTEFGYQTRPPDPRGVSPAKQAAYLNQSEYIAWRNPFVRTLSQFLLVDDKPVPGISTKKADAWATFQSGLIGLNARHKPAFDAYELPIWLPQRKLKRGRKLRVWGLVRLAPNGVPQQVQIQFRALKAKKFARLTNTASTTRGYVNTRIKVKRSGTLRLAWHPATGGRTHYSRPVSFTVR